MRKEVKSRIEKMPMLDLIDTTTEILKEVSELSSARMAAEFEDPQDSEYSKGAYVFEDYFVRQNDDELFESEPIIVEGVCYRLGFQPNGEEGDRNHTLAEIWRYKIDCLNLDTNDNEITTFIKMIHSLDPQKDSVS